MDGRPAVAFENVHFSLGPDFPVFSDLSLVVPEGERCVISGTSGTGFSFLARLAVGLCRPSRGHVRVLGFDVSHSSPRELHGFRQRIGVVFREGRLIGNMTAERNIALPLNYHQILPAEEARRRVDDLVGFLGLNAVRDRRPYVMAAHERIRTALARSAVMLPEVLFFDDPLAGFSRDICQPLLKDVDRVCGWVRHHRRSVQPPIVVIAASDPEPYAGFAQRFGVMRDGQVHFDEA